MSAELAISCQNNAGSGSSKIRTLGLLIKTDFQNKNIYKNCANPELRIFNSIAMGCSHAECEMIQKYVQLLQALGNSHSCTDCLGKVY